jgi:hypothetical protein
MLPARISPGSELAFNTELQVKQLFDPQSFGFEFTTSRGEFTAFVRLHAIPRHFLDPPSISRNVTDVDPEIQFEFVQRDVFCNGGSPNATTLSLPDGFTAVASPKPPHEGELPQAPGFRFVDRTFKVAISDKRIGLNKGIIVLNDPSGLELTNLPVVWKRTPFASCVPEKIYLGPRVSRVFLKCADPSVELTRVVSAPAGVKAVIASERGDVYRRPLTSPSRPAGVKAVIASEREVSVSTLENAPSIIDGEILVETNNAGHKRVAVRVVRYSQSTRSGISGAIRTPGL